MTAGDIVRVTPAAQLLPGKLRIGDVGVVDTYQDDYGGYLPILLINFPMVGSEWLLREALEVVGHVS